MINWCIFHVVNLFVHILYIISILAVQGAYGLPNISGNEGGVQTLVKLFAYLTLMAADTMRCTYTGWSTGVFHM